MKYFVRILSALLILAMAFSVVACSDSDKETKESGEASIDLDTNDPSGDTLDSEDASGDTEEPSEEASETEEEYESRDLSSYADPSLEAPELKALAVPAESTLKVTPGTAADAKDCVSVTVKANDVYTGSLVLVNSKYALKNDPGSIKDGLVNIYDLRAKDEIGAKYKLQTTKITVRRDTYDAFVALMKTANAANAKTANVLVSEGYRTAAKQQDVFVANDGINALKPNHSDFQTGYSVHLKYYDTYTYSLAGDKNNADVAAAGTVIVNLADDFGFIRRYPEGKEAYTGVVGTSLPYLFRYVGVPHARVMTEGDYSLEEYIDGIKNYKESNPLRIEDSGYVYHVFYVPSAGDNKDTTFNVPKNHDYTWSGNNVDGFIVTVTMATPDAK